MEKILIEVLTLSNKENIVNGSLASNLILQAYKKGIVFPKNATNGDIIKALFPDSELHKESDYAYLTISKGVYLEDRDGTWWNAPYKAGDRNDNKIQ